MSSPSKQVTIKIGDKSIRAERDALVCVVYMHSVGPTEALHEGALHVITDEHEPLTLEPGGSMVAAGVLADHIDAAVKAAEAAALRRKGGPMLARVLDAGGLTVYARAEDALGGSAKATLDMIRVSRHAATLESWLAVERARDVKRVKLIEALELRLRQYGLHTGVSLTLDGLGIEPQERKAG